MHTDHLKELFDYFCDPDNYDTKEPSDSEKMAAFEDLMLSVIAGEDDSEVLSQKISDMIDKGYFSQKILEAIEQRMSNTDDGELPSDDIEHPDHYTFGPIECFELIRRMEGDERAAGFAIGSCWKYMYRHNHKGQDLKDLAKVAQFAEMYREVEADIQAAKEANKVTIVSTGTEGMMTAHPRRFWMLSCQHSFITARDDGIPKTCPICSREIDQDCQLAHAYDGED